NCRKFASLSRGIPPEGSLADAMAQADMTATRGRETMANLKLTRQALLAAVLAAAAGGWLATARAAEPTTPPIQVTGIDAGTRFVPLGIGKSVVIDLPVDVKDVLVSDPKVANAVVRSSRRAYLIGVAVGQANVFFFDAAGRQIAGFDIAVSRDLNGIRAALRHMFPDA